jgi:predicted N-acetyltransferase YhbS
MEIRALRESDDRSGFRSGDADLDRFLHKYAGQNQFRHSIGVSYVAVEGTDLLGYATVAPGQVGAETLPAALRGRLPRYPVPILRLARLAVDARVRGKGIGESLLRFVLSMALRLADEFGCVGVVVDAKAGAIAFYERFGFAALDAIEGQSGTRPLPAMMFLHVSRIRSAKR